MTSTMRPTGHFAWTYHHPCLGCIRKYEHECACKAIYHYDPTTRKLIQLRYPPALPPTTSFLELPAELRNHIYELAFAQTGTLGQDWWQPAICFATRQLRQEALPLFYALTQFRVTVGTGRDGELADIKQAKRWVLSLDEDCVRNMRKVSLHAVIAYGPLRTHTLEYDLSIGQDGSISCCSNAGPKSYVWDDMHVQRDSIPLARAMEALRQDIDGKVWCRKTFIKALGGIKKVRSKAVMMLHRRMHPGVI